MLLSLKAARVNADLTQKEVAEKLEISQSALCSWESGRVCPRFDYVLRLCELYKIEVKDIFLPIESTERGLNV